MSHEGVGPREIPDGEKVMFEKLERNKKRHDHHRRRMHKSQVEGDGRIVMVEPPVRVPTIVRRAAVVPATPSPAIAA